MTARIAVLASGGGSNLEAILTHLDALGAAAPARVVLVASDRADAFALERARRGGIEAVAMSRDDRTDGLAPLLESRGVDVIALAGFLRLVPDAVTRRWRGRIVNVHPSLLPAFGGAGMYGRRVHAAVLASGARLSGATVHFVDEVFDRGPIIAQWPVPVLPGDDAGVLAARVLRVEHLIFPRVVCALAAGCVRLTPDGRAELSTPARAPDSFTLTDDDAAVAHALDALIPAPVARDA